MFEAPTAQPDLLIVAGEHSGDEHAAKLVEELLEKNPHLSICALAGPCTQAAGAHLIYDMMPHAVVGFWEVFLKLGTFHTLMQQCIRWIDAYRPHNVLIVDYPGFNLRLADRIKAKRLSHKGGGSIGVYAYISPQIWAWKAGRRFKMAQTLDGLGAILPFEIDHFKDTDLPVEFVGHPLASEVNPVHYDPLGGVILLPGSRAQPVRRIFPIMLAAFEILLKDHPTLKGIAFYPSELMRVELSDMLEDSSIELQAAISLVPSGTAVGARAVLTSSGTMSLRAALAGIPGAIVYTTSAITYGIAKRLIRVKYLGLASIVLGEIVYPEYIQSAATPQALALEIAECIRSGARHDKMAQQAQSLYEALSPKNCISAGEWLYSKLGLLQN